MTLEQAQALVPWKSKVRDTDGSEWLFKGLDEDNDLIVVAPSGRNMYLYREKVEVAD